MSRPTLQQLGYLVALADEGNFRRAAQACFVSQPALSTQIKELERRLGATLIERTPRGALLTPAGRIAAQHARQVLQMVDDLAAAVDADGAELTGAVDLGVIPTLAPYILPTVVPVLTRRHPRAELRVRELRTEVLLDELAGGAIDIGLIATSDTPAGVVHQPLAPDPFLLATSEHDDLADGLEPVSLDALTSKAVLLLEDGHCLRDQALDVCRLAGASEKSEFRATSLETLRQMVAAGVGVTLLPTLAVKPPVARSRDIRLLPFEDADPPSRRIGMAWRRSSARAGILQELAGVFRSLPPELLAPPAAAVEQDAATG